MLAGHLTAVEPNDAHKHEFSFPARGRYSWDHPIHLERVRKANHELFDYSILAEDLGQGDEFEIRRKVRQHFLGVELMHACATYPARPCRDVQHVWVFGHRSE